MYLIADDDHIKDHESQYPELRTLGLQSTLFPCDQQKEPKACWATCLPPVCTTFSLSGKCGKNNLLDAEESMEGENAVGGRA